MSLEVKPTWTCGKFTKLHAELCEVINHQVDLQAFQNRFSDLTKDLACFLQHEAPSAAHRSELKDGM
jgi:hypothetical protein